MQLEIVCNVCELHRKGDLSGCSVLILGVMCVNFTGRVTCMAAVS